MAARFGYTPAALQSAVRDFRAGAREFFLDAKPGPKPRRARTPPGAGSSSCARHGHSIDEIAAALAGEGIPLNRTGIAEVIAEQGLPRLWRRPDTAARGPRRAELPRAEVLDFGHAAGPR